MAKAPGDTLIVRSGTYVESVTTWSSGSSGKPIVVKANPGDTVVWRGGGTDPSSLTGAIYIQNQSFIRIQGFRFDGSVARATIRVLNTNTSSKTNPVQGIEIVSNTFVNNGNNGNVVGITSSPIYFQYAGHSTFDSGDVVNTISGNTFDGNYGYSIALYSSNDTVVSNNTCRNEKSSLNTAFGVYIARFAQIGSGATRNVIESNVISNFTVDSYVGATRYSSNGMKLDAGASGNIMRRNIIHDLPGGNGIMTESGSNNNQTYENIVYNIGANGYVSGSATTNVSDGNTFRNNVAFNCACGMRLSNAKNTVVRNNIFYNNSSAQIWVSNQAVSNGGNVFSNNDYFKTNTTNVAVWNTSAGSCSTADKTLAQWVPLSKDTNSLSADPKFVNPPSDFHLQSTSPVRDKGENGVDMGAYPGNPGAGLTISLEGPAVLIPLSSASSNSRKVSLRGAVWKTATPESQGLDGSKLEAMVDVLASRKTSSLLVIRNDRVVCEWYEPGRDAKQRHYTASLAKALIGGVSLMVTLNDGHIKLDEYASRYIPAWLSDPFKSKIRIRHLASHTSGIEDAEGPEGWKRAFWARVPDPFSIAINDAPCLFAPGSDSTYSNPGVAALAYAVTASLRGTSRTDISSQLKERIMDPLGIAESEWSIGYGRSYQLDGMKLYSTWGGASFTPRAVAKVGLLMLHKGNWEGRQLVGSSWTTTMVSRSTAMPDHGLTWSINLDRQWPSLPRDAYAGAGSGHQLLLVVPSLNLIVVRNGGSITNESDFWAGLEEYVFEPLMNAVVRK